MDTGVVVALITAGGGLVTALLVFAQPIVLKVLEQRGRLPVAPPPVMPDDDPVDVEDEVTMKRLAQALLEELRQAVAELEAERARADACESREASRGR